MRFQFTAAGFDNRLRRSIIFYSLTNPSPDEERVIDLGTFVDEEEGDIDDESDVELDGNNQLDLDLDPEHNDDLESDLLSDTEDRNSSDPQLFQNRS